MVPTNPFQAEGFRYWLRRYAALRVRQISQELRDGPRKRPSPLPMAFRGVAWTSLEDTAALAERVLRSETDQVLREALDDRTGMGGKP